MLLIVFNTIPMLLLFLSFYYVMLLERVEDEDPEDSCPINYKVLFAWCWKNNDDNNIIITSGSGRNQDHRKKILMTLSTLALIILSTSVGRARSISEMSVDSVNKLKRTISWNEDTDGSENNLLHLKDTIPLPKIIDDNIADVTEPFQRGDVTYFFHIPRTGGASVRDVSLDLCLTLLCNCCIYNLFSYLFVEPSDPWVMRRIDNSIGCRSERWTCI